MAAPALGLFGKLPRDGDFIQRHLPGRFVRPWDDWLSHALAASRTALGAGWSEAYLLSPPWRFLLAPDVIDDSAWTGVLLSSVDRVRRSFPLTLAMPLEANEKLAADPETLSGVLGLIEATALDLVAQEQTADEALARIQPVLERALADARLILPRRLGWAAQESLVVSLAGAGDHAPLPGMAEPVRGRSLWWHHRWNHHAPASVACDGLPAPEAFSAFLDGDWPRHGWQPIAGAGE